MRNVMDKLQRPWLLIVYWIVLTSATDPESNLPEKNERGGRSWHHALFGPQMLMQHQQNLPVASTSQPGDASNQQTSTHQQQPSDPSGSNRNFEDLDKNNVPAASEQDFMSRHFGYLNVHRFDPNFPYYDRNVYPRFPSPHTPRFGPGYRKDKYGHGYGYSCKQGDDCDEVRAANQLTAMQPPPPPPPQPFGNHPYHHNPMSAFGNQYPELPAFPSVPSFPNGPSSFGSYGGHFPPAPARFNDPHGQPMMPPAMMSNSIMSNSMMSNSMMPNSMMSPPRYYHGRYLHDQEEDKKQETPQQQKQVEEPEASTN